MKASIEISMYPLDENYVKFISAYIEQLKSYNDIEVHSNTMSTQIFGEYDRLMEILSIESKKAMEDNPPIVIVFKLVNADLRPNQ